MCEVICASNYLPILETLGFPKGNGVETNPSLAERWEYSTDYLDLTIFLREGIPWQGGWGEVTAEDVKWTFEQMMSEGSKSSRGTGDMRNTIESMEVIDPHTLVIHQKMPSGDLFCPLFLESEMVSISCKKYIETVGFDEANNHPVGSGPWSLVEHRFGDYLKYEAADEHWRCVPEFEYLILRIVPEESTRVAMFKTEQIDATLISPSSIAELPEEGFTVDFWPGSASQWGQFGGYCQPTDDRYIEGYHNTDPWVDIRVREAMNIAIDRDAINKAIMLDTAESMAVPELWNGWEELEPYPYDPERAKQLLAEAGYPDGFSFKIYHEPQPAFPVTTPVSEAVAGYWEEIGLTVEFIVFAPYTAYPAYIKPLEDVGAVFLPFRWPFTPSPASHALLYIPNK
ncbi:ABC transporter substrate-binding protein, partial [Chloroflexota bacterium]